MQFHQNFQRPSNIQKHPGQQILPPLSSGFSGWSGEDIVAVVGVFLGISGFSNLSKSRGRAVCRQTVSSALCSGGDLVDYICRGHGNDRLGAGRCQLCAFGHWLAGLGHVLGLDGWPANSPLHNLIGLFKCALILPLLASVFGFMGTRTAFAMVLAGTGFLVLSDLNSGHPGLNQASYLPRSDLFLFFFVEVFVARQGADILAWAQKAAATTSILHAGGGLFCSHAIALHMKRGGLAGGLGQRAFVSHMGLGQSGLGNLGVCLAVGGTRTGAPSGVGPLGTSV